MALSSLIARRVIRVAFIPNIRMMSGGEFGSGAGKGGGGGGNIRSAGGKFGEMEAAREEEYFRKLQAKQLDSLKKHQKEILEHHDDEIRHLEEEIKEHREALDRIKKMKKDLQKNMSSLEAEHKD